jgi:glycosyltransferase involved in cell wall biosynthesis
MNASVPEGLLFVAKSTWSPSIRREHALARLAARHGHAVHFLERQGDVRALLAGPREPWVAGVLGRPRRTTPADGVDVIHAATVVPGHRGRFAERLAGAHLRRDVERLVVRHRPGAVIVGAPWQWTALRGVSGPRKVFDAADDWRVLIPERRALVEDLYRRIAREADAIVLVSDELRDVLETQVTTVVPNGADDDVLAEMPVAPPGERRMVYVGTLSPRFDAPLLAGALAHLDGWGLDLYGQCQYPGRGAEPDDELASLLTRPEVAWHGVVPRSQVARVLDRADVAVMPHRASLERGQDSMKLYDYAARARSIVASGAAVATDAEAGVARASTPEEFAAAVVRAAAEPTEERARRRSWAERQRWACRWEPWRDAVLGTARP